MKFSDAIRDALFLSMRMDKKVLCYGLGVPDPKGIFGTTIGLQEEFGSERVFDMPLSENAMTGVAIGAAIRGYRPVMAHQRFDFFLLAMDQLVNGAAKWHMMFGGRQSIPLTIRLIVGRGWGQGPTHCQSLHGWLAHIPGLKVVMPSNPANAKGLLMESIQDPNPVIFVEHRWLHGMEGTVPSEAHKIPLGRAALLEEGDDLTIVASSLMVVEARHAIDFLRNDIKIDLIDLQTIRPIDWSCIFQSVQKTGRLLVLDIGSKTGSLAGEIIASVASEFGSKMKCPPERICMPDHAVPTSFSLTKDIYPNAREIAQRILKMMNLEKNVDCLERDIHDIPGDWFKGPF